jgi:PadR family transcriptional regulator, regulatory protein PadR
VGADWSHRSGRVDYLLLVVPESKWQPVITGRCAKRACFFAARFAGTLVETGDGDIGASTLALTFNGRTSTIIFTGGRTSSMAKQVQQKANLLQGTLDMLILRTLLYGPAHGHHIGKHIQRTTNDFLQMQHGSLYPALHRLERRGWVTSKWEMAPDRNREFKYYRLTDKGRKQLVVEESEWKQMAEAVARVMWPAAEES